LGRAIEAGGVALVRGATKATTSEVSMKLVCGKCRRVMDVRKKDVEAISACIEGCRPFHYPRDHWGAQHLVCPFCKVEGNGEYWLERMRKPGRAEKQGEAA
jgi:hypothetical protein